MGKSSSGTTDDMYKHKSRIIPLPDSYLILKIRSNIWHKRKISRLGFIKPPRFLISSNADLLC